MSDMQLSLTPSRIVARSCCNLASVTSDDKSWGKSGFGFSVVAFGIGIGCWGIGIGFVALFLML